jgi:poly-gamma-glutamate synthesis protein (capsule biosynthesis protein)
MKHHFHRALAFLIAVFLLVSAGCTSLRHASVTPSEQPLRMNFAGDIMAHTVNFNMPDYDKIYENVIPILRTADVSFGNLEIPVADSLPLSTYPRFNVHTPYVKAAVDAGFTVFSLANNHSNDQGTEGIIATRGVLAAMTPPVVSSGLRSFKDQRMKPALFSVKGKKILFLAVTEILNSYDGAGKLVYYVAPTIKARTAFLAELAKMRKEHPCDIFVLSIHLNEPEYVRTVNDAKRTWFAQIAEAGVDIVWGHHPHVMQDWELVTYEDGGKERQALFMYSMGNFISGQRYAPDRENPDGMREYTGDGVILQVTVSGGTMTVKPIPLTNYTDPKFGPVVRPFDDAFVSSLSDPWIRYYRARYELMQSYLPELPPMPVNAIIE